MVTEPIPASSHSQYQCGHRASITIVTEAVSAWSQSQYQCGHTANTTMVTEPVPVLSQSQYQRCHRARSRADAARVVGTSMWCMNNEQAATRRHKPSHRFLLVLLTNITGAPTSIQFRRTTYPEPAGRGGESNSRISDCGDGDFHVFACDNHFTRSWVAAFCRVCAGLRRAGALAQSSGVDDA